MPPPTDSATAVPRMPAVEPFETRMLDVGDGHTIYVERVGRRDGIPALFLHGGPGSGCQPAHRSLFDPERFSAVLFDQRGAGRSTPWLSLEANTTQHLIDDIERIRTLMGFERMMLVGGSWGSTLALAYAERHPQRVSAIVLRAIFLGTRAEVDWAFIEGPRRFRPELYEAFVRYLPEGERADLLEAYYRRLVDPYPAVQVPTAWTWHAYERALSELSPHEPVTPSPPKTTGRPPPTAVLEAHYLAHDCFLAPDELIANAGALAGLRGTLIQSRYDMLCPPDAAFRLARAWPGATLQMIEAAGHAMTETGVRQAMIEAIDRHARRL